MCIMRPPNDTHTGKFQMARRHHPPGKYRRSRSQTRINASCTRYGNRIRPHPKRQEPSIERRQGLCPHPDAYVYADGVYQDLLQGGSPQSRVIRVIRRRGQWSRSWHPPCLRRILLLANRNRSGEPRDQIPKPRRLDHQGRPDTDPHQPQENER